MHKFWSLGLRLEFQVSVSVSEFLMKSRSPSRSRSFNQVSVSILKVTVSTTSLTKNTFCTTQVDKKRQNRTFSKGVYRWITGFGVKITFTEWKTHFEVKTTIWMENHIHNIGLTRNARCCTIAHIYKLVCHGILIWSNVRWQLVYLVCYGFL